MQIDDELKREILTTLENVHKVHLDYSLMPNLMNKLVSQAEKDPKNIADYATYIDAITQLIEPAGVTLSDNISWLREKITKLLEGGEL